jgi:hypothetical protein
MESDTASSMVTFIFSWIVSIHRHAGACGKSVPKLKFVLFRWKLVDSWNQTRRIRWTMVTFIFHELYPFTESAYRCLRKERAKTKVCPFSLKIGFKFVLFHAKDNWNE